MYFFFTFSLASQLEMVPGRCCLATTAPHKFPSGTEGWVQCRGQIWLYIQCMMTSTLNLNAAALSGLVAHYKQNIHEITS